jgi:hypothetical protein
MAATPSSPRASMCKSVVRCVGAARIRHCSKKVKAMAEARVLGAVGSELKIAFKLNGSAEWSCWSAAAEAVARQSLPKLFP